MSHRPPATEDIHALRLLAVTAEEVALIVRALETWAYWEGSDEGARRYGYGLSESSEQAYELAETLCQRFGHADAA